MPKKIIIIEDDPDILDVMTYILSEEGYEIIGAANSAPLVEVDLHQPMLILMDDSLADGFGRDFCKQFKSDPLKSRYPVVLVSANSDLERIMRESDADAFLKKPFDIADLIGMVKKFE
jgi:two-component system phosphate regulon response regulator PhoB